MLFEKAIKNQLRINPTYKLARPKSSASSVKQTYLPITKIRKELDESFDDESVLKIASRPATSTSTRKTLSALSTTSTRSRKITSVIAKREIKKENFKVTKPRSPSPFKEKQSENQYQKPIKEINLDDFCDEPKYPRFTTFLSKDAQLTMLLSYKELIKEYLLFNYPQYSYDLLQSLSLEFETNCIKDLNKMKVSHLINAAMKIIDLLRNNSKDYDPLFLFNQWVYLCNKEIFK